MIKHLILLKIQSMMDTKELLVRWFINFLIKGLLALKFAGSAVKSEIISNKELAK